VPHRVPERFRRLPRERAAGSVGDRAGKDHGKPRAVPVEDFLNGENRGFRVERVEYRLEQEKIHAAFDQAADRLGVGGPQLVEGDVAEAGIVDIGRDRGGAVGGPERTRYEARPRWIFRGELVGRRAREPCRLDVELVDHVLQAVIRLRDRGRVEGVGLDHVGTGREVLRVNRPDHAGLRQHQQIVVALEVLRVIGEALAAVVRLRQPVALDHGAEGAVEDQNAIPQQDFELCDAVSHKRWSKWCKTLMQKAVILRHVAGGSGLRL
jgi:hypothetical protein